MRRKPAGNEAGSGTAERRRRRPGREPRQDPGFAGRRRRARRGPRRLPGARRHGVSAGGPPPQAGIHPCRAPGRSTRSRPRRRTSSRSSARRGSITTSRTPAPCVQGVRSARSTGSTSSRTTASSTSTATSPRDATFSSLRFGDALVGSDDLRGRLAARSARDRSRARGSAAPRQPLRVSVPRRQGRGARGDARDAGTGHELLPRVLQPRRAARTSSSSTGTRSSSTTQVRSSRELPGSPSTCWSSTSSRRQRSGVDSATCAGASSTDLASRCRQSTSSSSGRCRRARPPCRATVAPFEPGLEQMRLALTLGLRDYVEKNGFSDVVVGVSGGIDSAVTAALCVDALGADTRALRLHALSLLVGGRHGRMPGWSPRTWAATSRRFRSSTSSRPFTTPSASRSAEDPTAWPPRTCRPGCAGCC